MIGVIDYEAGNTLSVIKALEYLGQKVLLTNDADKLMECDHIVFPGVGAYYDAMERLSSYNLIDTIKTAVSMKIPFLGICLGMQLLFESSEETIGSADQNASEVKGLGILPGRIMRFKDTEGFKIPQIGWNSVSVVNKDSKLFTGIEDNSYFYFVHSYYLKAENRADVAAQTEYINMFDCAVEKGNIFGCQFHPEKSGEVGLGILKAFTEL